MAGQPLAAARRDFVAAERALNRMRSATTLDELEAAWRSYLQDLNKVWTKVELACKHRSSKFQPWQGKYARIRKGDMLLRYLHHARNSDEHTLTEIVSKQPGGIGIAAPKGVSEVYIKSMTINSGPSGVRIDYDGTPAELHIVAPYVRLERVYDRGQWYNPPTQHLDAPLEKRDPVTIASLGLDFYRGVIEDAERTFFPPAA